MTLSEPKKMGIVALVILLIIGGSLALVIRLPTGMEGTRVAIYYDRGALPSSATALFNMYNWMNAETNYINSTDIQQGVLDGYDLVVFPGGSSYDYSGSLGSTGRNAICDFVANGGSYFGICGGSVFGTKLYLMLFDGYASGAVNGSGTKLLEMIVNTNSTGPDLSGLPASYDILYWDSGYFYSNNATYESTVIPITFYPQNNQPGMIVCKYGSGTVFLSFPHPEYEEGSVRDGTDQFDYYADPDSEWDLMLRVSLWLIASST